MGGELGVGVFALGLRLGLLGGGRGFAFFSEFLFPGGDGFGEGRCGDIQGFL